VTQKVRKPRHSASPAGAGSDPAPAVDGSVVTDGFDSGEIETLPDGSISIPVLEEELVVTKRVIVRERIIVRRNVVTERRRIDAELRRERVEFENVDEQMSTPQAYLTAYEAIGAPKIR
jgi:stress response protein YsnF